VGCELWASSPFSWTTLVEESLCFLCFPNIPKTDAIHTANLYVVVDYFKQWHLGLIAHVMMSLGLVHYEYLADNIVIRMHNHIEADFDRFIAWSLKKKHPNNEWSKKGTCSKAFLNGDMNKPPQPMLIGDRNLAQSYRQQQLLAS